MMESRAGLKAHTSADTRVNSPQSALHEVMPGTILCLAVFSYYSSYVFILFYVCIGGVRFITQTPRTARPSTGATAMIC